MKKEKMMQIYSFNG